MISCDYALAEKMNYMDRRFVSMKLWSVFVEPRDFNSSHYDKNDHEDIFLDSVYRLLSRPHLFGGKCDVYNNENYRYHKRFPNLGNKDIFVNGCPKYVSNEDKVRRVGLISTGDIRALSVLEDVCYELIFSKKNNIDFYYARNLYEKAYINLSTALLLKDLIVLHKWLNPTLDIDEPSIHEWHKVLKKKFNKITALNFFTFNICKSSRIFRI